MSENRYRIATAGLLGTAMGISGYFRRRAETGEETGRRATGAARVIMSAGTLGLIGILFGYLFAPSRVAWARISIPRPLRWLGGIVAGACLPLFYWVFATLDRNVTPTADVRQDATLVTDGPYRFVRHPLYTAAAVFWLGLTFLSGLWVIGVALVLVGYGIVQRTPEEEQHLAERFGDEYREYCERTGRYVPNLWR